ncbi:MAG: hypothetical protein ACPG19_02365 [Saprospiraceae bacterium]
MVQLIYFSSLIILLKQEVVNKSIKKALPFVVILAVSAVVFFSMKDTEFFKQMPGSLLHGVDTSSQKAKTGAFGELVGGTEKGVQEEDVPEYIRRPKVLEDGFSGYKIEIKTSYNEALSLNDELFQSFGGVKIDRRKENSYTYLVGDFNDKASCDEYFEKIISPKYPKAVKVKYKNGELVEYK